MLAFIDPHGAAAAGVVLLFWIWVVFIAGRD